MKQDEVIKYLGLLGKHEQYGLAIRLWLEKEVDKRVDIRKIETPEELLDNKAVIRFIKKELNIIFNEKAIPKDKPKYN